MALLTFVKTAVLLNLLCLTLLLTFTLPLVLADPILSRLDRV